MYARSLSALVLAGILAGCGALFNGGPQNVTMSTNPPGAEIWIDGTNRGVSPAVLPLAKNRNHVVTFRRAGYSDTTVEINRKVGATWVILDVLAGVIPVVIDAATGGWYVLDTSTVNVNLVSATAGTLTPQQLAAVRMGARADNFIPVETQQQ